jgi:hypothetical protein
VVVGMRIKSRITYITHSVMDGLIDLHAAMDPDSGHFICHYLPFAPVIVEIGDREFPGLNIGEFMTVILDSEAAGIVRNAGEKLSIDKLGEGRVNDIDVDDDSLALLLNFYRYNRGKAEFFILNNNFIAIFEDRQGTKIIIILWRRKKRKDDTTVLTV